MLKTSSAACASWIHAAGIPLLNAQEHLNEKVKRKNDYETSFELGISPESWEATSQHVNNIKESEYQNKMHDCAYKF